MLKSKFEPELAEYKTHYGIDNDDIDYETEKLKKILNLNNLVILEKEVVLTTSFFMPILYQL